MANMIITIARGYGSNGKAIGKKLASELDINYYDRNLLGEASEGSESLDGIFGLNDEKIRYSLNKKEAGADEPRTSDDEELVSDDELFNQQAEKIRAIAESESCVIVGRCADHILRGRDNVTRIYIYASPNYCTKTIMKMYGVSPSEAEKLIAQTDRERASYYEHYTGNRWNNFANYDLCLSASTLGIDGCVKLIKDYIEILNK